MTTIGNYWLLHESTLGDSFEAHWCSSALFFRGLAINLSFQNMSGLNIKFGQSEVIIVGTTDLERARFANLLNCKVGKFPISYLGLLVSDKTLRVLEWDFLTGKVGHRVDPWHGLRQADLSSLILVFPAFLVLYEYVHAF
jgi:hypothetical protein